MHKEKGLNMKEPTRFPLADLPTPLSLMDRLGAALNGPEIWIKRDDQTGLATGGNKTRKLELLIGEALQQGADVVLTVGAVQSNHCRQTAAAAAWAEESDPLDALADAAGAERAAGRRPYGIPYGGSNALGAAAYALAFEELWKQIEGISGGEPLHFDRVVFASSSGGTHAGLVVGARACGYEGQVLGISVDKTGGHLRETVSALLAPTAARLGLELSLCPQDVQVDDGFLGGGYAVLTGAEREAIRLVARTEGILLDPVYTGKAMAGLIGLIRQGEIGADEKVLFWHTGGSAALFAYAGGLLGD
jgi:D-cysteine desulfhydrase